MKNEHELENPLYALVVLCIVVAIFSIKPMYLYATDKQAYYQYQLSDLIDREQFVDQRFKDNQLTVDMYLSSMSYITKRELEILSEMTNNKNT